MVIEMDEPVTARTYFGARTAGEMHDRIRAFALRVGVDPESLGRPDAIDAIATPAVARLEHWRWLADCPNPFCNAALLLTKQDEPFMCGECFNADIGRRYRPVVWPQEAGRIEAALRKRPHIGNRHWFPTETAEDLERENDAREVR